MCYARRMHWRGYLIVTFFIAVLAGLFFISPFLQDIFFLVTEDVNNFASGNIGVTMIFFIALAAFSAMFSPFSSTPIVPIAVSLWGWEITAALLLSGWIVGDIISYAIGFFAGHPLLRQFVSDEKAHAYEARLSAHMTFIRALLVRLALPAEVGYAFGLIKYHIGAYLIATIIAEVPFVFITVHAASALVALNPIVFLGWFLALCVLVGVSYFLFHTYRNAQ